MKPANVEEMKRLHEKLKVEMQSNISTGVFHPQAGVGRSVFDPMNKPRSPIENPNLRMHALNFRMRVGEGEKLPFDLVDTFYVPPSDKVFVLIITKGNAVVLEDSVELYPSDTLLTQIRLIE